MNPNPSAVDAYGRCRIVDQPDCHSGGYRVPPSRPATTSAATQIQADRQTWFFTFGHGQEHDGKYVVIPGTHGEARAVMLAHFGTAWCDQYGSAERAGVEEFGLVELPREEWPPLSLASRAINALSAFGVKSEREAGQLLPMWLHYSEMTVDDRTAVYRHYRTGGVS